MTAIRLPTVVTPRGQQASGATPIRRTIATSEMVQDPDKLAHILTQQGEQLRKSTLAARVNPRSTSVTRKSITVPSSGTFTVPHNLNRAVSWIVVRWIGTAPCAIWEIANAATKNSVTFGSSAAGTADVEFF